MFTPKDVEYFTGIRPEILRLWRQRGLIDEAGELQENGRWLYWHKDVIALAAFDLITRVAEGNRTLWGVALVISDQVMTFILGVKHLRGEIPAGEFTSPPSRYLVAFLSDGAWQVMTSDELVDTDIGELGGYIFDLHRIARELPTRLFNGRFVSGEAEA